MSRPRVHVISLGGTITMRPAATGGVVPELSGEDLVAMVPGLVDVADVSAETRSTASSTTLRVEDLVEVTERARRAIEHGVDGVVVVQGTDTLEESAFVAEVLHVDDAPIVLTGAMRAPDEPGADGPANLRDAVVAAAAGSTRGLGALVCLGGQLHSARHARKTDTASPAAFASPGTGPLGWVVEGHARIRTRPVRLDGPRPALERLIGVPVPPVALHRVSLGDDGRLLGAVADAGYAGLVVDALGAGHVPAWMVEALAALARRIPVVLASRTGGGEVLRSTYGFPGSERDLLARGLLSAGALDALRARLVLALALADPVLRERPAEALATWTP